MVNEEALERIRRFVVARKAMRGMDPQEVAIVNPGSDKEASLTIADLEALLAIAATAALAGNP